MTVESDNLSSHLNALPREQLVRVLGACCSSMAWVDAMISSRPYKDNAELFKKAENIWFYLQEKDWLEAFRGHPKIGDTKNLEKRFSGAAWSKSEQAGIEKSDDQFLEHLKALNGEYETKFGFIFIVCATGKTAQEMLDVLLERLKNSRDTEVKIAGAEQSKITALRLEKLV